MKLPACFVIVSFLSAVVCTTLAQTAAPNSSLVSSQVPRLIKFSGVTKDESGKPMTGVVGINFSLYKDQQGGSPLWVETQNAQADAAGHYTAMLGSASADGVPLELFSSGEAQWLGVQIHGQPAQARVLLVSVPYALKAHEAETLSGRSISDFVLLKKGAPASANASNSPTGSKGTGGSSPPSAANGPTNFVGNNATQVVSVTQKGAGAGLSATSTTLAAVRGTITGKSNTAIYGLASNTSKGSNAAGVTGQANTEKGPGVAGYSSSPNGTGVLGIEYATSGSATGVVGVSTSPGGSGVSGASFASSGGSGVTGFSHATTGFANGVFGQIASTGGNGVSGIATATSGNTNGVYGQSASTSGIGVSGNALATTGNAYGVYGQTASTGFGAGIIGNAIATTGTPFGVYGNSAASNGNGVFGYASATSGSTIGTSGFVESPNGTAGRFVTHAGSGLILQGASGSGFTTVFTVDAIGNGFYAGNLNITGKLTKGSGSFKIDHPLDPANKYLSHSFVESPDMMNVYNGNITTDRRGLATVTLPDYFEALNGEFRYQLTVIGKFAQAIVAKKIDANRFVIRTSKPNVEVSWQVTGIRHDAYANQYRIPVEEDKAVGEQGYYLHPEVFGQPESKNISMAPKPAPSSQDVVADASHN